MISKFSGNDIQTRDVGIMIRLGWPVDRYHNRASL
jgi:hypothetical protein